MNPKLINDFRKSRQYHKSRQPAIPNCHYYLFRTAPNIARICRPLQKNEGAYRSFISRYLSEPALPELANHRSPVTMAVHLIGSNATMLWSIESKKHY